MCGMQVGPNEEFLQGNAFVYLAIAGSFFRSEISRSPRPESLRSVCHDPPTSKDGASPHVAALHTDGSKLDVCLRYLGYYRRQQRYC